MVGTLAVRQPRATHLRGLPSAATGTGLAEPTALPGVRTAAWPAVAGAQTPARVPGLAALLGEVDRLRRDLRADLTLAATAAEAGEPALAAFLLHPAAGGPSDRLNAFELRALAHLRQLEQDEDAAPLQPAAVQPAPVRRQHRRWLPGTPLVAAAAALFGFLAGTGPDRPTLMAAAQALARLRAESELLPGHASPLLTSPAQLMSHQPVPDRLDATQTRSYRPAPHDPHDP